MHIFRLASYVPSVLDIYIQDSSTYGIACKDVVS